MNYFTKLAIVLVLTSITTMNLNAQTTDNNDSPKPGTRISGGFKLITPTGDTRSFYDGGYGLSVQADIPLVSSNLYLTSNSGFETIFAKEDANDNPIIPDIKRIPVKAGLKYFPVNKLYVHGEAGASILTNKPDFNNGNTVAFMFSPQVGYLLELGNRSALDLGVRYEYTTKHFSGGDAVSYFAY